MKQGITYRLRVASDQMSYGPKSESPFTLRLDLVPPPPNDNFADRIVIRSLPAVVTGTTLDGSLEVDEPEGLYELSTVWYEWVAPATGILRVRLTGTSHITLVNIFSGTVITDLTWLDAANSNEGVEANIDVQQGVAYQFRIAPFQSTPIPLLDGPFTLRLEYNLPPPNDNFADRIRLTNAIEAISFRNLGATPEPSDGAIAYGGRTVWYQWRAPESGTVHMVNGGGSYNPAVVGIYSGTENGLGSMVTNNLLNGTCWYEVSFSAVAGQIYQLMFDNCGPTDRNRPAGHSWTLTLNGTSRVDPVREPDGTLAIKISGDNNRTYALEGSTNLVNWTPVLSGAPSGIGIQDLNAANYRYRFYRARLEP